MKQLMIITIAFLGMISICTSQTKQPTFLLTGDLKTDFLTSSEKSFLALMQDNNTPVGKKSVLLATALSAVVPGAGEFYTESYWRTGIFVAVEATLWIVNIKYNNKGNNQTTYFESYANADHGWSVVRYATWIKNNFQKLNPSDTSISPSSMFDKNGNVIWANLNKVEDEIGRGFSHVLPTYGTQQYYELIGKYPQFDKGWYYSGDPMSPFFEPVCQQFLDYAAMRGKANDYYDVASTMLELVVVNHVLSAVDAALCARSFNKLHSEASMQVLPTNGSYTVLPTLHISYSF